MIGLEDTLIKRRCVSTLAETAQSVGTARYWGKKSTQNSRHDEKIDAWFWPVIRTRHVLELTRLKCQDQKIKPQVSYKLSQPRIALLNATDQARIARLFVSLFSQDAFLGKSRQNREKKKAGVYSAI